MISGIQSIAYGLLDGGVEFATAYPGFHAHALADLLGINSFSINEKNAFAVAWGASIAGKRSACMFKNVGLNDAADPFVNACALGVRAGMVLVVLDDIEVEQSQIRQDSRPYADFPCSLWLEPCSIQEAYNMAYQAPSLSENLETLVVLRITNLLIREFGHVTRTEPVNKKIRWLRDAERWVAHPVYGKKQRLRLIARKEKIAKWVDSTYPCHTGRKLGSKFHVVAGMPEKTIKESVDLFINTIPLPRPWLALLSCSNTRVIIEEHGEPYIAGKLSSGFGTCKTESRIWQVNTQENYRITDRYEPLYALLRDIPNRVIVGDLGGHTLDPEQTIDVCLCYGCSIGVATGISVANPSLRVFCITGDAAFRHSGKIALEEALHRKASITVILLDNGVSKGTGGQILPGNCQIDSLGMEEHELIFPSFNQTASLQALLSQSQKPIFIRLRTPF